MEEAQPPPYWLRSSTKREAAQVLAVMHHPVSYQESSSDSDPRIIRGPGCQLDLLSVLIKYRRLKWTNLQSFRRPRQHYHLRCHRIRRSGALITSLNLYTSN